MLPKCVLCAPPRFSRRHHKAVGACILDRRHRWQEGERLGLWDSRPSLQTANGQHPSAEQRRALATSLAREGFDRKACAGLVSNGLCAPTAETMAALRALHPQHPPPPVLGLNDLPLAPEVAPDLVARCLRAFPADTAAPQRCWCGREPGCFLFALGRLGHFVGPRSGARLCRAWFGWGRVGGAPQAKRRGPAHRRG